MMPYQTNGSPWMKNIQDTNEPEKKTRRNEEAERRHSRLEDEEWTVVNEEQTMKIHCQARIENAEWRTRKKKRLEWRMNSHEPQWRANNAEQRKNYNENGEWSKQDTNEPDEEI